MIALGELPGEHHLLVADAVGGGHLAERIELALVLRLAEAAERTPAHEGDAELRAVFERVLRIQIDRGILVLHGHEPVAEDIAGDVDLLDRRVRDARPAGHALVQQLLDGLAGLVVRHFRIGTVEVQQVDGVHAERLRGLLGVADQVFGLAVLAPGGHAVGEVAVMPDLGGDQHLVLRALPAVHRLAHQLLAGLLLAARAVVGPGGVDMTAAGVQRGMDGLDALGPAEVVLDGQGHLAQTDGRGVERPQIAMHHHNGCSFVDR